MKTYNKSNFFKHTFCEFQLVKDFDFPEDTNYKSKSDSLYFYTDEGVYRKSNHWGRVANCRWKLIADAYKNQETVIGFAKWIDFFPNNTSEKLFFLSVDFDKKKVKINTKSKVNTQFLFSYADAQKRKKQIQYLFKEHKWANYFDLNIEDLRLKIITEYITSNRTLKEIKQSFK